MGDFMKTIRDLSIEIGVSKQAIFARMKKEPLAGELAQHIHTMEGTIHIDDGGQELLRSAFAQKSRAVAPMLPAVKSEEKPKEETGIVALNSSELLMRQEIERRDKQIETLHLHLSIKDKQIDALNQQIRDLTTAMIFAQENIQTAQKMAQSFHSEANQKEVVEVKYSPPVHPKPAKKRIFGIFSRD